MTIPSIRLELFGTPFTVGYVNAGGVRTRYIEAGDGDPLVLLHGTGGHLEAYARNIAPLAKDFRVIAYDMLGHGYTDRPDIPTPWTSWPTTSWTSWTRWASTRPSSPANPSADG